MISRQNRKRELGMADTVVVASLAGAVLAAAAGVWMQGQRLGAVPMTAVPAVNVLERVETLLTSELLPLNPAAGDLVYAGADSVVFRAVRGLYAVCDTRQTARALVTLRPLAARPELRPDSALVHVSGAWQPLALADALPDLCPDRTLGWTVTVPEMNGRLAEVPIGSPVRVFRQASYWLASEAGATALKTDALEAGAVTTWVFGKRAIDGSAAPTLEGFRYLDASGGPARSVREVRQIEIEFAGVETASSERVGASMLPERRTVAVRLRNAGQ